MMRTKTGIHYLNGNKMAKDIKDAFTRNRAEYYPDDVFGDFAIPPFLQNFNIMQNHESWRIIGARGSGKTMFLKYLCHATAFSPKRDDVSIDAIKNIGVYWRPDTQLCSLISEEWLGDKWKSAFLHYLTLILIEEIYSSIRSIQNSNLDLDGVDLLQTPVTKVLSQSFNESVNNVSDLKNFCDQQKFYFSFWLNNTDTVSKPKFLSPSPVLPMLIDSIAESAGFLDDLSYMVFVDEYENLSAPQQSLINDHIKHSKKRLRFSYAMKKHAEVCKKTSGDETIAETHDYKTIDLESEMSFEEFKLMAAEFVVYRLSSVGAIDQDNAYSDPGVLTKEGQLPLRLENSRVAAFVEMASTVFPSVSAATASKQILDDSILRRRLSYVVEQGLKLHKLDKKFTADDFIVDNEPEASLVCASVLNRKNQDVFEVKAEFDSWIKEKKPNNKFKGWIDNNLFGVIFLVYKGLPKRTAPLYAGFERFCTLSRKNMRHFQELCHESLMEYLNDGEESKTLVISPAIQAKSARKVSERNLVEIVPSLGIHGERLRTFVSRLGMIFSVAAKRYAQSEPEVNHFSINISSGASLSKDLQDLIQSSKVWTVLYEENKTKSKSESISDKDYVLNPIFAPFYGISYRKIRKIDLEESEVNTLFFGNEDEYEVLYRKYLTKWKNAADEQKPSTAIDKKPLFEQDELGF